MATKRQQELQQGELHELATRLSEPGRSASDRLQAVGRIVGMDAQGVDCSGVFPHVMAFSESVTKLDEYVRLKRYVGVLSEKYTTNDQLTQRVMRSVMGDFSKPNPLAKGLAVRQAGHLLDDTTTAKFVDVITRGASDTDPYVRKAAALAILNLHEEKPSNIETYDLAPVLKRLVEDSNPNVAANAVAALTEINEARVDPIFTPNSGTVNNLLAAIDQATEWSQIEILDFVSTYKPKDTADARGIIQRVTSRLSHANAAVVLSAIRCCLQMNTFVDDQAKIRDTLSKVILPLVTLLNNSAPIQYIAVKSILILLQNYKRMLSTEVTIFFCKYDDPLYMKLAKLDVILTLANTQNVGKVLEELFDYAQQTDVEFVRKSVRAIGKIAVQFESAAAACVDKLVALINTKVHYVVQECIVVAVDIFRRYPGKYEGIIANINASLSDRSLDDHRAKAAMVWILGEYADNIGNAGDLLEAWFIDDFADESPDVQLAILTAVVKYYLITDDGDEILRKVIKTATQQVESPDIRDRAFQYYWLVSEAPQQASAIVLPEGDPPRLQVELFSMNPELVEKLVPQIGTLAVLYNKLPRDFVRMSRFISLDSAGRIEDKEDDVNEGLAKGESSLEQLNLPVLVEPQDAYGVELKGTLMRIGDNSSFVLRFTNYSETPLDMQQIAFNKNIFGFAPGDFQLPPSVRPQKTLTVSIPVVFDEQHLEGAQPSASVQIAILVNRERPIFFYAPARLDLILVPGEQGGKISRDQFFAAWKGIDDNHEFKLLVEHARIDSLDVAKLVMQQNRLFFLAKRANCAYFSAQTIKGDLLIAYLDFETSGQVQIGVKMWNQQVAQVILELIKQAIQ